MDLRVYCPEKVVDADKAVAHIKSGSRVFIGTGCGEPQHLIRAMVNNTRLQDIMVYQMLSSTLSEFVDDPSFLKRFSLKLFFISASMRQAAFDGKIDYIPAYLSQIPGLFTGNRIGLDAALIQVSPPNTYSRSPAATDAVQPRGGEGMGVRSRHSASGCSRSSTSVVSRIVAWLYPFCAKSYSFPPTTTRKLATCPTAVCVRGTLSGASVVHAGGSLVKSSRHTSPWTR